MSDDTPGLPRPPRLLLCLGPCMGEFYLPLEPGGPARCPNDGTHPVAVYQPLYTLNHREGA